MKSWRWDATSGTLSSEIKGTQKELKGKGESGRGQLGAWGHPWASRQDVTGPWLTSRAYWAGHPFLFLLYKYSPPLKNLGNLGSLLWCGSFPSCSCFYAHRNVNTSGALPSAHHNQQHIQPSERNRRGRPPNMKQWVSAPLITGSTASSKVQSIDPLLMIPLTTNYELRSNTQNFGTQPGEWRRLGNQVLLQFCYLLLCDWAKGEGTATVTY